MKIRAILIPLFFAVIPLAVQAQFVTHPVTYGAGGGYLNNWYKNYVAMRLDVVAPSAVAGEKIYSLANDGSGSSGSFWGGVVTSPLVNKQVVMPQPGDSLCTVPITTSMTGKIALVYRGVNEFADKALAAQTAGAIACIIVNNQPGGPVFPGPGVVSSSVTIPVIVISKEDGDALDLQYLAAATVTVTLTPWGRGLNNDLGFVPKGIAGWSNFATPANQLTPGSARNAMKLCDGAFIANYGSHTATNVKIKDSLWYTPTGGSPVSVNTGITPNLATFVSSDSIYAMFNTSEVNFPATAAGNGRFDLKYTIVSDSADQYAGDNTATYSFYKTDSLYSKGSYDFVKNIPAAKNYIRTSGGSPFTWGPAYYVAHGGTCLSSVQFSLSDGTGVPGPIAFGSINVRAYKWVDGTVSLDSFIQNGELIKIAQGTYNFTFGDSSGGTFKARMGDIMGTSTPVMLDSNSWYYIAVEVPSGFFLGADGVQSPYPRVYGRDFVSSTIDYSSVMWPGDFFSLDISSSTQAEAPCSFPAVFRVDAVDSFNYNNLKGLIPAVSMIVNNNPLSLITGPTGMCIGDSHTFTDPIAGGTWTSSNPSVASVSLTGGTVNAIATGTTVLTYHVSSAIATLTVSVAPFPSAGTISGPSTVCEGSTITLTESVPGGFWIVDSASTPIAASVSSTGVVTGLISGSFETIYYVVSNACANVAQTHFVSIGPAIVTGSITGPSAVCAGSTITLADAAPGGTWGAAGTNISVSGSVVTGITAGTDVVSYTVTTSCGSAAATAPITVNPLPTPMVVAAGVNLSTSIPYSSYQWLYSGSPIGGATSATFIATLDGAYAVTVTDANGCSATSGVSLVSSTAVHDVVNGNIAISIAPNPTPGAFSVTTGNAGTFTIYSIQGRKIKQYTIAAGNSQLSMPDGLATGAYLCRFESVQGNVATVRLTYEPK